MKIKTKVAIVGSVCFVTSLVLFWINDWKLTVGLFLYDISVCLSMIYHIYLGGWKDKKEEKAMIRPLKAWRGYCGNCKTEFSFQDGAWNDDNCPICGNTDPDYELIGIPDYETPAQYEKRTGKPFDDDGAVWYKKPYSHIDPKTKTETGEIKYSRWLVSDYERIKMQQFMGILRNCIVVIASPPVPPPDDWEPEEA